MMQPLTKPDVIRLKFEAGIVRSRDDLFVACFNAEERFDGFARLYAFRRRELGVCSVSGQSADPMNIW
ncbi:hypothetical protein [Rhizobium sp. RCC_161_2]|uniref:hypothetical protein n=1 Tax=Rhizobium sp. RCC_161_2 TaxID=3239219 RepID=UPI0035264694